MYLLGCLSGMSIIHTIIVLVPLQIKFVDYYRPLARIINLLFLVLANISLILCFAMVLIYKQKAEEKKRALDASSGKLKQLHTVSSVILAFLFVAWAILFYLPNYTTMTHY